MAGFLDDVGNFFDGLGKKDDGKAGQSEVVEEVEGVYTGSTRIITIPGELLNGGFVSVAGPLLRCHLLSLSDKTQMASFSQLNSTNNESWWSTPVRQPPFDGNAEHP